MIPRRARFFHDPHNNFIPNQDKTTCPLFTPGPPEYTRNLDLKINNTALPMPKVLGPNLNPKVTYSTHIHNIAVNAHKPLQLIKAPKGSRESGSRVCLFHIVASLILDQHLKTASSAERSIENCHRMDTTHKHITPA